MISNCTYLGRNFTTGSPARLVAGTCSRPSKRIDFNETSRRNSRDRINEVFRWTCCFQSEIDTTFIRNSLETIFMFNNLDKKERWNLYWNIPLVLLLYRSFHVSDCEEYRDTITLCQSKHSCTRSIYIRKRRTSRRCRIYNKSRMHYRKGKNTF